MERPRVRGDALLQLAHLVGQGRLVAHGRGHAAEEGRHLGAGLDEPEDVVDEEQHVLALHVAEVLGHREGRQRHAQAHAGRLVHLAEHQGGLVEHARLGHLDAEVGALTGALAHAGEDRHTAVLLGHPADHLGDEHGLAHAGAAEQADLAALHVGGQQVDDLDAGLEHLGPRLQRVERRRRAVDLPPLQVGEVRGVGIEGRAPHVPDVAEDLVADGHLHAVTGVAHGRAAGEPVGRLHADGSHPALAELLGHLGDQRVGGVLEGDVELQRLVDLGQRAAGELDVDDGTGDRDDPPLLQLAFGHGHLRTLLGDVFMVRGSYEVGFGARAELLAPRRRPGRGPRRR